MDHEILIGGVNYCLTSDDNYLQAMGNIFEPHMVALFSSLIEQADTVIDIGANIGLTSILFSNSTLSDLCI